MVGEKQYTRHRNLWVFLGIPALIAGVIFSFLFLSGLTSANAATLDWAVDTTVAVPPAPPPAPQQAAQMGPRAAGDISGIVTSQAIGATPAAPVENVSVAVTQVGGGFFASDCTDASGAYLIAGAPQDVDLIASAEPIPNSCTLIDDDNRLIGEYYDDQSDIDSATTFQLVSPNFSRNDIDFELGYYGSIGGNVTALASGASPAGVVSNLEVTLYELAPSGVVTHYQCTDGGGNFRFDDIIQDRAHYAFINPNISKSCVNPPTGLVAEYWDNQATFNTANAILVNTTTLNRGDINFELVYGGTVRGNVTALGNTDITPGTQLQYVPIKAWPDGSDTPLTTCTDASGDYTIYGLPFDTDVRVLADPSDTDSCAPVNSNYEVRYYDDKPTFNTADVIQVSAGTPLQTGVDFVLDIYRTISGTVSDVSGVNPIARPNIVVQMFSQTSAWNDWDCTEDNGSYSIGNVPGDESIIVYTDGLTSCNNSTSPGSGIIFPYKPEYWQESPDLNGATAIIMTDNTASTTSIDLTLDIGSAPVLTIPTDQVNQEGDSVSLQVMATDADNDTLTYGASNLPPGLSIDTGTGLISGTVSFEAALNSPYTVTLTVTENTVAALSDSTTIQWTVDEADPGVAPEPINLTVSNVALPIPIVPTFSWTHQTQSGQINVPSSTYGIYLTNTDASVVWYRVFNAVDICSGIACEVTPTDQIPAYGLLTGDYQWWVGADEAVWSGGATFEPATFSLSIPNAALPGNIQVLPNEGRPTVTFASDPNTWWVNIYIGPSIWGEYFTWHERDGSGNAFTCSGGTCTMSIPWDAPAGTYYVWMQTWGPGGYSEGGIPAAPSWVQGPNLVLPATPASLPDMLNVPNPAATVPTFEWRHVDNSTWFNLIVTSDDYSTVFANKWWQAGDIMCPDAEAICMVNDPDLGGAFSAGNTYRFYVRAWGPGGFSVGGLASSGYAEGTFTP